MGTEDVDVLLEWYLEGLMPDSPTKVECRDKHALLEKDIEEAIEKATASVESRIKLWIFGAIVAALLSVFYIVVEVGIYKERIDTSTRQIETHLQEGKTP